MTDSACVGKCLWLEREVAIAVRDAPTPSLTGKPTALGL